MSSWYHRLFPGACSPSRPALREILVVDDQPDVRAVLRGMLERVGWRVLTAASREEALVLVADPRSGVVLALVDVILPGTDGVSLALELQQVRPRLEILMLSGRLNDESRWIIRERGYRFLAKPFGYEQLRDVVADILGEPDASSRP